MIRLHDDGIDRYTYKREFRVTVLGHECCSIQVEGVYDDGEYCEDATMAAAERVIAERLKRVLQD